MHNTTNLHRSTTWELILVTVGKCHHFVQVLCVTILHFDQLHVWFTDESQLWDSIVCVIGWMCTSSTCFSLSPPTTFSPIKEWLGLLGRSLYVCVSSGLQWMYPWTESRHECFADDARTHRSSLASSLLLWAASDEKGPTWKQWRRWEPLDPHSLTAANRQDFVSHQPLDESLTPVCKLTPSSLLWLASVLERTNHVLVHRRSSSAPHQSIYYIPVSSGSAAAAFPAGLFLPLEFEVNIYIYKKII